MLTLFLVWNARLWECFSRSSILLLSARLGVFAARPFERGAIVVYFYGSLVYENVTRLQQSGRVYGEHVMSVTAQTFKRLANKLPAKATDRPGKEDNVRVVRGLFCAM